MYVEGLKGLRAQSLYNGRVLWEFSAPGILDAYHREHSIGAAGKSLENKGGGPGGLEPPTTRFEAGYSIH